MKKLILSFFAFILSYQSFANCEAHRPALDRVTFQVSVKGWVTTKTALVTVAVNATLTEKNLVKARADILSSLAKIAGADWHLTQFDRSQDNSGLEKLYVEAQARVEENALANIYSQAKKLSQPGINYSIMGVEFKPSLEEIQAVKTNLREQVYALAKAETSRLNQMYPDQHYSLKKVAVFDGDMPVSMKRSADRYALTAAAPAPANLNVSNELVITAMVVLASNRQESAPLGKD